MTDTEGETAEAAVMDTGNGGGSPPPDVGRFMLNPHLRVIRCSKDEVLVKHGSRSLYSQTIADEHRTGILGRVLEHAVRPTSVEQMCAAGALTPDEEPLARETVHYLEERQVLVRPEDNLAQAYLSSILGAPVSSPTRAAPELANATVAVVGAGPVGSLVARGLAASGVGQLIIIDPRAAAEVPALDRYFDLPPGSLKPGAPLAAQMRDYLAALESSVVEHRVADPADPEVAAAAFADCDLLVVAWETVSPRLFHALNEAALEVRKPWMPVFFDGSEAIIGPTFLPGASACYLEFEVQSEATLLLRDELVLYKDHAADSQLSEVYFALPSHAQIAAGLATTSVLRMLLLGNTFTSGRAVRLDLERLAIDTVDVLRLPRCPACRAERPAHRHLFL